MKASELTIKAEFGARVKYPIEDGIYHFQGKRHLSAHNGYVTTNDLVEVITILEGDQKRQYVRFFGRGPKFPIHLFEGSWRKLSYDFDGERSR